MLSVAQSPPDTEGKKYVNCLGTWEVTGDQSCFVEWWGQRLVWVLV